MYYEVIPEGKTEELTYFYDGSLLPGQIVLVPIGRRTVPGVVIKKVAQPNFKTRPISKILYTKPLPPHLLATVQFMHEYYLTPSGAALSVILPKGVEKQRRKRKTEQMFGLSSEQVLPPPLPPKKHLEGSPPAASPAHATPKTEHPPDFSEIPLNPAQKKALEALQKAPGATKLLHGVTGSGKTNIYLKMALNAFRRQKSTIVLVPEIALTSQLVRVFQEVFGASVIVIHSKQTEAERHLIFNHLLETTNAPIGPAQPTVQPDHPPESPQPYIVIGPRSALFAPLNNLGLIIIDEEHETTYYQENTPKYSAIRVASFIAKALKIDLILGSATPTIEDYYLASRQKSLISLAKKAKSTAFTPDIKLIDFKDRDNFRQNRYFSTPLLAAIKNNLENHLQTLIFHNRRGSAPLTICENCGEELLCPNCYLPLTLHADSYVLRCHTCDHEQPVPPSCPKCGTPGIIHKGFGTKLLEAKLRELFPKAKIRRFDADNKKGESLEELYHEVRAGQVDILIGTQTLAKGLDLPKLATVGVVQADAGLSLPDYLSEEKTFQLLTQVIGRVGRGHLDAAEVYIQTFRPDHPVINYAITEDYLKFYQYLLHRRQKAGFPPYKFLAKLEITMKTEATVIKKVRALVKSLEQDPRIIVSPPQPAFHERTAKGYTWQLILRSRSRQALQQACQNLDQNFRLTLDPPSLL